jgi:hypothetical protein
MPAAPLLMVGAQISGVSAAVGSAVASAVVGATVSTAVATAVGSGIIAAGVTAAMGGDANDVLKAAVIGGGSAYLGNVAGGAAGKAAQAAGYSDEVTNIVSAAAAGGAENTAQALGYGADLGEALKEGAVGSLAAGATVGTLEAFKEGTQPGVKIPASGSPTDVPEVGLRAGTPQAAPDMGGASGVVPPSDALLPASTRRDIAAGRAMVNAQGDVVPTMRTPEGRIIPAMVDANGNLIPSSSMETTRYDFGDTSTKYGAASSESIDRPYRPSALGETGEAILAQYIYPEFASAASSLFNRDAAAPASQTTQLGTETVGTPSSAALAQALRVSPGEPVFGSDDTGKQRRVWNVSSLKLKDEVGG